MVVHHALDLVLLYTYLGFDHFWRDQRSLGARVTWVDSIPLASSEQRFATYDLLLFLLIPFFYSSHHFRSAHMLTPKKRTSTTHSLTVLLTRSTIPTVRTLNDSMNSSFILSESVSEVMHFGIQVTTFPLHPTQLSSQKIVLPIPWQRIKQWPLPKQSSTDGFIKCTWTIYQSGVWWENCYPLEVA